MKIPVSLVKFVTPTYAADEPDKSLGASKERGISLWYVGHGLLVERAGRDPRLVPISNVSMMEAKSFDPPCREEKTIGEGFEKYVTPGGVDEPKKRGPGRPPKVQ
jgi:hypothetical protein